MKIKAAVMTAVGKPLEIREVELDKPKSNEVLVKILATAICHSDLNTLNDETTPIPQVLGHEGAGIVVETGESVKTCKKGDFVTLSWVPYCGTCAFCRAGKVNLCESAFGPMFGGTLMDGTSRLHLDGKPAYHMSLLSTFAEYTVVPEMSCIPMPEGMPAAPACMIGCGVATGYGAAVCAAHIRNNRYPLFRNDVMETVIRLIIPFCISRIIIIKELTAWIFFVITTPKRKGYAIILPTPRYFRMIRRTKVTGNLGSIISRFMQ